MTIRSHDQFNTTIYGLHDRYRGVHGGRRVLFMNPEDLAARGWSAGQRVDITSHFHHEQRVARQFQLVSYAIPRRCVAVYYPEGNVLVPIGSVAAGEQPAGLQVGARVAGGLGAAIASASRSKPASHRATSTRWPVSFGPEIHFSCKNMQ